MDSQAHATTSVLLAHKC
jgi:hypothetical protein